MCSFFEAITHALSLACSHIQWLCRSIHLTLSLSCTHTENPFRYIDRSAFTHLTYSYRVHCVQFISFESLFLFTVAVCRLTIAVRHSAFAIHRRRRRCVLSATSSLIIQSVLCAGAVAAAIPFVFNFIWLEWRPQLGKNDSLVYVFLLCWETVRVGTCKTHCSRPRSKYSQTNGPRI